MAERSVLHVLPHPGGGGETYVDLLSDMPGYRFTRLYLAPSPTPSAREFARGLAAALRRGRHYDLVHVHGEVAAGLCLPLLAARPSVVTWHGLNLVRRLSGLAGKAAVLNLRTIARAADATICVSEAERAHLISMVGAGAARRAVVVHNGARLPASSHELDRAETRKALGLGNSEPVAIWVGSLHSHKDPLVAVRAAEQASVTLLLVGDGPLRPEVERTARRWARVLGRREDVPRLLAAADFFVLTSHHEGFSFSLLESMAHRLPAVVTDLPENVEAVGDAGFAVRCADEHALTGAVRRLAENVREREELGRRAQSRVSQLLSAERMIAGTRAIYDRVLARLAECYTPSPVLTLSTRFRALTPRYRRAQREAQELYREWNARGTSEELLHPMWHAAAGVFGEMVSQGVPADFLTHPLVRHMFYRTGFGELEQIQAAYIDLTKPWIREMCARYREPSVGQPVHDWPSTGSSVSTLNKLYYFCRIVESAPPSDLRTVLEFGGGYGLMCHMLEELLEPRPTYIMIDLPELLALQYVFLRAGTAIPVTPHTYPPIRLREKTVNLVPVQLVADADLNCDLFLSTFALSETPLKLQEFVAQERRFFGARHVYLVGQNTQDDLWREYALEEMNSVRDTVQRLYDSIRLEPFPVVSAWELIASQPRPAARL